MERRKYARINAEFDVLYDTVSESATQKQKSISRNISEGGINLALSEKLFPGMLLKLQLNIPEAPRAIAIEGEVMWIKELSDKNPAGEQRGERQFATGIKFTQVKPEDSKLLQNLINQRIKAAPEKQQQQS